MTIMNASHEYEAARETFKAGDQRTLSSKIFKLHDFLMMHSFSFRHCDEENEVNVHRVHEATLFMATIISNQADRAIEEQTHLIKAEMASASYRPSTSRSAKTPAVLQGSCLWAETPQSAVCFRSIQLCVLSFWRFD